ncbi:hypothetical protein EJ02DRAFT_514167 [Clathrospora elynae]|uniref:Uncharacterized protein n=1 Tax=Clathrospora elynae TaxID=706981 RepID=A0A6A5SE97_9PLEO|nr:hypothetical protein EJ02DRAFT_514167 [Clathrospora elynae]
MGHQRAYNKEVAPAAGLPYRLCVYELKQLKNKVKTLGDSATHASTEIGRLREKSYTYETENRVLEKDNLVLRVLIGDEDATMEIAVGDADDDDGRRDTFADWPHGSQAARDAQKEYFHKLQAAAAIASFYETHDWDAKVPNANEDLRAQAGPRDNEGAASIQDLTRTEQDVTLLQEDAWEKFTTPHASGHLFAHTPGPPATANLDVHVHIASSEQGRSHSEPRAERSITQHYSSVYSQTQNNPIRSCLDTPRFRSEDEGARSFMRELEMEWSIATLREHIGETEVMVQDLLLLAESHDDTLGALTIWLEEYKNSCSVAGQTGSDGNVEDNVERESEVGLRGGYGGPDGEYPASGTDNDPDPANIYPDPYDADRYDILEEETCQCKDNSNVWSTENYEMEETLRKSEWETRVLRHMVSQHDLLKDVSEPELKRMIAELHTEIERMDEPFQCELNNLLAEQRNRSFGELSSSSARFERSNAPTPDDRRPEESFSGRWRQFETEMAMVQLQDLMEESEKQVEHLTKMRDMDWNHVVELQDQVNSLARHAGFWHSPSDCMFIDPTCGDDGICRVPELRGGMGGRDEDEYVYGDGECKNWDQVDDEPDRPITPYSQKVLEYADNSDRVFVYNEAIDTWFLTTDGFSRGYEIYQGKKYEYEYKPTPGEPADEKGVEELKRQIENLNAEIRERLLVVGDEFKYDGDTPPVEIEPPLHFTISASRPGELYLVFGKWATALHFPDSAPAKQKLALQVPNNQLGQDVDDVHITHFGAPHMEQQLKTALKLLLQGFGSDEVDWDEDTCGKWPGVEAGDTSVVGSKDVTLNFEDSLYYGCRKADWSYEWCYGNVTHFDKSVQPDEGNAFIVEKVVLEYHARLIRRPWYICMGCREAEEQKYQCVHKFRLDTHVWWPGVGRGDTYVVGNKDVQFLYYDEAKEEVLVGTRGGNGGEETEGNGGYEHWVKRLQQLIEQQKAAINHNVLPASFSTSPHLICQHTTSRVDDTTVEYILIYIQPGFTPPLLDSGAPRITSTIAATIDHFSAGAIPDVIKRVACKQKGCGEGRWEDVKICAVYTTQLEYEIKSAIARTWDTMGLSWDMLTRGDWSGEGQDNTYIDNDRVFGLSDSTRDQSAAHMRGGRGDSPEPSNLEPIQRPSPEHRGFADDFNHIYQQLLHETVDTYCRTPPTECTYAWMRLATVLQTRNRYLERELEEFKEMYYSFVQDVHWQMGTQVELEEQLEAMRADKAVVTEELDSLKVRWAHLLEFVASQPNSPLRDSVTSPGLWAMRGGDEESYDQESQPAPTQKRGRNRSLPFRPPRPSSPSAAHVTATSFDFFPERSTIVFPGDPPHIYQFPSDTTLPQIREVLEFSLSKEDAEVEPYTLRILEIMKTREAVGVQLPDILREEKVVIKIPYVLPGNSLDQDVKIAAWQDSDADVDGLETFIRELVLDTDTAKENSLKPSTSIREPDCYRGVGDLVNALNGTVGEEILELVGSNQYSPAFCACDSCTNHEQEVYFKVSYLQIPPLVSVRGGGKSDNSRSRMSVEIDSDGNRQFPLRFPGPITPPNTPQRSNYPTYSPARDVLEDTEGQMEPVSQEGPLAMRLGRKMFPRGFVRDREDDIRCFDWRRTQRSSPQAKNWRFKRGKSYTKSSVCEEWAAQLDKHRECCEYCQAVFLEEEAEVLREQRESVGHEDEAPMPRSGAGRPWERGRWPENANTHPFLVVEDPNPYIRGGAGNEKDLESEDEDWRPEWEHLANQAHCSSCQCQTFRKSSTRSINTTVKSPSPIDRSFSTRRPLQTTDFIEQTGNEKFDFGPAKYELRMEDAGVTANISHRSGGLVFLHCWRHGPRKTGLLLERWICVSTEVKVPFRMTV